MSAPIPDPEFAAQELQNVDAEVAYLGAVLFDNETIGRCPPLLAEDFYYPEHQFLFEAIKATVAKGQVADGVTLRARYQSDPRYVALKGTHYIMRCLSAAAPLTSQAYAYAEIIKDLSTRRRIVAAAQAALALAAKPPDDIDNDELVSRIQRSFDVAPSILRLRTLGDSAEEFIASLDDESRRAIPTGLKKIDERLGGGFYRGDLIILAGRPSMGKTTAATNIARNAAALGAKVGFFSLEMSATGVAMRSLAAANYRNTEYGFDRFHYSALRNGAPNINRDHLNAAADRLKRLPLIIDDRAGLSVEQIEMAARAMRRRLGGLDLVVVDYLQLIAKSMHAGLNFSAIIGQITEALKRQAKELNVAMIALSQLSRGPEQRDDKRPQLSDLRESGNIEQDADVVIGLFREAYYLERREPSADAGTDKLFEWQAQINRVKDQLEFITLKQRQGSVGSDVVQVSIPHDLITNAN